jgi:hypothetical protein
MIRLGMFCLALFALALVLSLAAPAVADEINGAVKVVNPDMGQFVIDLGKGKTRTFQMDEDAQVLIDDMEAELSDLRIGDRVTIVHRRDGENWMAIEVRCLRQ